MTYIAQKLKSKKLRYDYDKPSHTTICIWNRLLIIFFFFYLFILTKSSYHILFLGFIKFFRQFFQGSFCFSIRPRERKIF